MSNNNTKEFQKVSESETDEQQEEDVASASNLTQLGDDNEDEVDGDFEIPQRFTKSGRKRAVPFPLKLMKVLSDKKQSHIITWMPSGKSFSILKPKTFVVEILPLFFKSAKYSSFTRKLHRWGFMRHYRGDEAGAFYHKDFQRDHLDLVEKMTCYKSDPPKAPVAKKTKAPLQETAPLVSPADTVRRLVSTSSALQPQQQMPMPQPRQIMSQLQQQQQRIKVPEISQLDAAERLNAAIEIEVARRLKERIQAAALSRQALALIQHQLNVRPVPAAPQPQIRASSILQAQLLQLQQQKQQLGMESSCFSFSGFPRIPDSQGLEKLPPTNIQGAKTA